MLKDKNIIAFGGFRNTGKDTSASMLQFMLNTPSIFHYYWIFKHFNFLGKLGKWEVTSFARPLKEVLSIILGVPVEKFEDRDFKENYCVNLNTLQIEKIDPFYTPIMTDKFFSKVAKELDINTIKKYNITIRQMLQYVGTECLRRLVSEDVWINATLKKNNIIISDLRFKREFEALDKHKSFRVLIERPGCNPGNHPSEKEILELKANRNFEGYIDNNGTLKDLFYNVKQLIDDKYVIK